MLSPAAIAPLIGSLLVVGFEGQAPPPGLLRRLGEGRAGGVILFARNFHTPPVPRQVAGLVQALAGAAPAADPPLLVSIDQEGGRVQRLRAPFTAWPPMARVATAALAEQVGRALGEELARVGVNHNFAPVLDVHSNPQNPVIGDRAFGVEPHEAAERALAFWRGMEAAGVRGCGKHFPGHGDTALDSHLTLPVVEAPLPALRARELVPFEAAVAAGVPMLMSAHVVYRDVDPARPATLSPRWLQGVLRAELGFGGVVVTDDLEMQAVAAGTDPGEVVVEALLAGCDAFLLCKEEDRQLRAEEALRRAADRDPRVQARVLEAAARVRRLRETLRPAQPRWDQLDAFPDAEHERLAQLAAAPIAPID